MDVCKCIVPSRHGGTLNSRKSFREVGGREERWETLDHLQGVFPQNLGGTELNRTVTFVVLKATSNDRRCHDEFRGSRSDYFKQVVNDININRCIVVEQPEVIELHGFSDASQSAYGAVVYCKSITQMERCLCILLPVNPELCLPSKQRFPDSELCAAVLLAKLVHRVKQALKLNVTNTFLLSDSMIVLSWIRKESYQLKTFVANRIATIQEMTSSEQWRYVATEDNLADFVSRGMDSLKT
ncbi:integrase catalytic domain-containing protein [Trichonephila clavipes]|nr:integrase catalytic domain-containing protein [Trichonephila clavipes]